MGGGHAPVWPDGLSLYQVPEIVLKASSIRRRVWTSHTMDVPWAAGSSVRPGNQKLARGHPSGLGAKMRDT